MTRSRRFARKTLAGVAVSAALGALACGDGELNAFATNAGSGGGGGGALAGAGGAPAAGSSGAPSAGAGRGGSGGAAGMPPNGLIDDFEDGDTKPIGGDWWYATGDTGPPPTWAIEQTQGHAGPTLALHASGEGYEVWGAQVSVDLAGGTYDASAFSEYRFWARVDSDSTRTFSMQAVDFIGKQIHDDIEFTTTWQEYVVPLAGFVATDGSGRRLDLARVQHMQFLTLSPERFSLWLDDVRFR